MMMDSEEEEEQTALVCDNGKFEKSEIRVYLEKSFGFGWKIKNFYPKRYFWNNFFHGEFFYKFGKFDFSLSRWILRFLIDFLNRFPE